jgi:hypothetical protein
MKDNQYIHEQYVDSVYWAIVTMSSVGYGDVLPTTTEERTWAVFVMVLGSFLYAYIIGAFSTIMAHNDHDKSRYDTKMRQVGTWLKFIDADEDAFQRVMKFYEYRFQNKLMFDDHLIVEELPVKLRSDLVLHRFQKTIDNVPFFKGLREDVVVAICMEFHQFSVLPGDYITHRGDPYRELLVMTKGICRSVPEDGNDESPRAGGMSARLGKSGLGDTGLSSQSSRDGVNSPSGTMHAAELKPIEAVVECALPQCLLPLACCLPLRYCVTALLRYCVASMSHSIHLTPSTNVSAAAAAAAAANRALRYSSLRMQLQLPILPLVPDPDPDPDII